MQAVAGTIVASKMPVLRDSCPSPGGKWLAEVFAYECMPATVVEESINAYEVLRVTSTMSGEAKTVDRQVQSCGGIGAAGLSGISWSQNGRFFYFTNAASGTPEGCGWWMPPTSRLDVTTWSVERLGSGPLSPDQNMRAIWQGFVLLVSSPERGEITRFKLLAPATTLSQIAWSPNSSALVYLLAEFDCFPWGKAYLVIVDLSLSTSRLLLEPETPSFARVDWVNPGTLLLRDQDDTEWTFDLATGMLVKAK